MSLSEIKRQGEAIRRLKEMLVEEIETSSNVFIIGHNDPDFDSIGSCIGLYELAKYYEKDTYIIVDDNEHTKDPNVRMILDENREKYSIITKQEFLSLANDDSLLIVTDVNKSYRISVGDSLDSVGSIIIIDHHEEDKHTIQTDKKFITMDASSASEIVTRVLNLSRIDYSKDTANYLLAGISLDTNSFEQNTTGITHGVARSLLLKEADIDYVNSLIFAEDFKSYRHREMLIINGTFDVEYEDYTSTPVKVYFTYDHNNPKTIYSKVELAKAANEIKKSKDVDASFVFGFIEEGIIHISARGGKRVDVGKIMGNMNGGGNQQFAGGRIECNDLELIKEELILMVPMGIIPDEDIKTESTSNKVLQLKR